MSPSGEPPAFVRLAAHPLRWRLLTALAAGDHRVRELAALLGEPQNLVSYHLRLLRDGALVTATRSSFDRRDSYYHLDLDRCAGALADSAAALHPALRREPGRGGAGSRAQPVPPKGRRRVAVLFVCTGGSSRSPIAEALLRHHGAGRVTVASAGTLPKPGTHPDAVRVLREEFGVDLAVRRPRHLDALAGRWFDHVITLCDKAREVVPGHPRRTHWSIPDPAAGEGYPAFRRAATEIDTRVRHLLPVLAATDRQEPPS
jgi:protein-tyrosine-phosphatase/DNA-binding transcriptional ArsR family regulator